MATDVMLTRVSPDFIRPTPAMERLERKAMESIRTDCPEVGWNAVSRGTGAMRQATFNMIVESTPPDQPPA